jgi:hypothetical protein
MFHVSTTDSARMFCVLFSRGSPDIMFGDIGSLMHGSGPMCQRSIAMLEILVCSVKCPSNNYASHNSKLITSWVYPNSRDSQACFKK